MNSWTARRTEPASRTTTRGQPTPPTDVSTTQVSRGRFVYRCSYSIQTYRVGSDAVITQDILENKSEKPVVRTTSENIESELADHYHITRTYSPPAYLAN